MEGSLPQPTELKIWEKGGNRGMTFAIPLENTDVLGFSHSYFSSSLNSAVVAFRGTSSVTEVSLC